MSINFQICANFWISIRHLKDFLTQFKLFHIFGLQTFNEDIKIILCVNLLDINFDDFDFSKIKKYFEKKKLSKVSLTKEEKERLKMIRESNEIGLKFAIVDGIVERVSNFRIEPRTLFKGRGEHPKAGTLKPKIFPEDVHINLSKCSQVPICLKPGHAWGSIVFEKKTTWLSSYAAEGGHKKYVFLGAGSKMKGLNDVKKYEKARELKKKISDVKKSYMQQMKSKSLKEKMLGTATYLIDTLAIRVGNEKNEDEADTVGCCSLRKEHLTFKKNNLLVLDFYGKDSMRYYKEISIDSIVYNNLQQFVEMKKQDEDVFDLINPTKLNEYLSSLMPGLTAKVFRTFNASNTLQMKLVEAADNYLSVKKVFLIYPY